MTSNVILALLKDKHITVRAIAKRIGKSHQYVYDVISKSRKGKKSEEVRHLICSILKKSYMQIFEESNPSPGLEDIERANERSRARLKNKNQGELNRRDQ